MTNRVVNHNSLPNNRGKLLFGDLSNHEQNAVIKAVFSSPNGAWGEEQEESEFPHVAYARIVGFDRVFLRTGTWHMQYCRWCGGEESPCDYEVSYL